MLRQLVQKFYWENGKLKSELHYVDGKLNGECVWYDLNGQRQTQASYVNDTLDGNICVGIRMGNWQRKVGIRGVLRIVFVGLIQSWVIWPPKIVMLTASSMVSQRNGMTMVRFSKKANISTA